MWPKLGGVSTTSSILEDHPVDRGVVGFFNDVKFV